MEEAFSVDPIDLKPTALVVDDEESIRNQLGEFIAELGFDVHTAADGVEGIRYFRAVQPDIVILDVYMPRMNGFKALHEIKLMDPTCPVVLITGYLRYEQLVQSGGTAADAYLQKPIKPDELEHLLNSLMEARLEPA
jgi:CheY-like chemotaxis protein